MNDEDGRGVSGNLKHPKITGPRMRGFWQAAKIVSALIFRENESIRNLRESMRGFRRKWGKQPPVTEAQWMLFWQGLSEFEDCTDEVIGHLTKFHFEMDGVIGKGLEIVEQNGYSGLSDPAEDIKRLAEMVQQ